ncbi:hypothetical protein [Leifsonia sp. NPDC077715]|uniref:hypothetical protein n=1 Tax=Leifsonia sp. NPDC077715 TaxID=3155539 RepID=UPI00342A2C10
MTVHSSKRRRTLSFIGGMALLGSAGLVVLVGSPAIADEDHGVPRGGDGSLHLLPDVIVNSGIEAGNSSDFPFMGQLFLPQVAQRADELAHAQEAVRAAATRLTFDGSRGTAADGRYTQLRDTLFDGYSPAAVRGAGSIAAPSDDDPWILLMAVAALPLTGLAAFLGAKTGARRRRARA